VEGIDVKKRTPAETDALIQAHLDAGHLLTNPDTGAVWRWDRDEPTPDLAHGDYARVYVAGVWMRDHRVMWIAHRGPIPSGRVINHLNGIKRDNRLVNLECVTQRQNALHGRRATAYSGIYDDQPVSNDLDPAFVDRVMRLMATGEAPSRATLRAMVDEFRESA
jgi:hypothetical protein